MDYVKQAFSLSDLDKEMAKHLYVESVKEMAKKNYVPATSDAFVDLSALFGVRWLTHSMKHYGGMLGPRLYAEANTAFNYANLNYCGEETFIELAQSLVPTELRVGNRELRKIAKQMKFVLTKTTDELVIGSLRAKDIA